MRLMAKKTTQPKSTRPDVCLNCGTALTDQYCAHCGQNNKDKRLQMRSLLSTIFDDMLELDLPIIRTVIDLTLRPGQACLEYIRGKRKKYSNPLRYFFIMIALFTIASLTSDMDPTRLFNFQDSWMFNFQDSSQNPEKAERVHEYLMGMMQFVFQSYNYLYFAAIPTFALFLRVTFRRLPRNYAEHLIFVLFIVGQRLLFEALVTPLGLRDQLVGRILIEIVLLGYFMWAALKFFEHRSFWTITKTFLSGIALQVIVSMSVLFVVLTFKIIPDVVSGKWDEVMHGTAEEQMQSSPLKLK